MRGVGKRYPGGFLLYDMNTLETIDVYIMMVAICSLFLLVTGAVVGKRDFPPLVLRIPL